MESMGEEEGGEEEEECDAHIELASPLAADPTFGLHSGVGDKLQALDVRDEQWCDAKVVAVRSQRGGHELKVHYIGWNQRWDEWIAVGIARLRRLVAPSPQRPQPDGTAPEEEQEDEQEGQPLVEYEEEMDDDEESGSGDDADSEVLGIHSEIGDKLEAQDSFNCWYPATVRDVMGSGAQRQLLMHYRGWKARFDEWIRVGTGRLRLPGESYPHPHPHPQPARSPSPPSSPASSPPPQLSPSPTLTISHSHHLPPLLQVSHPHADGWSWRERLRTRTT